MLFEKLADARLTAGWSSIQQAIHTLMSDPTSAIELLHSTYDSLDETQKMLYLYSPQLVARINREGQLDGALLFEPPRTQTIATVLSKGCGLLSLGWFHANVLSRLKVGLG